MCRIHAKKLLIFVMMGGMILAATPAFADTCPSNQSDKKLHKLEVTAGCILDQVTVDGGLTVRAGAHLQLSNSTVNGGINVDPHGKLELQASTISGGIVLNNADDIRLHNSVINGGVLIAGPGNVNFRPTLCNMNINGGITVTNANIYKGIDIGVSSGGSCSGSNITGHLAIDKSVVSGLFNANIKGSLRCINGGMVKSNSGNTITGSNTC
jgi:hypothetical protein